LCIGIKKVHLKDALEIENPVSLLKDIPDRLNVIADREEQTFNMLKEIVR